MTAEYGCPDWRDLPPYNEDVLGCLLRYGPVCLQVDMDDLLSAGDACVRVERPDGSVEYDWSAVVDIVRLRRACLDFKLGMVGSDEDADGLVTPPSTPTIPEPESDAEMFELLQYGTLTGSSSVDGDKRSEDPSVVPQTQKTNRKRRRPNKRKKKTKDIPITPSPSQPKPSEASRKDENSIKDLKQAQSFNSRGKEYCGRSERVRDEHVSNETYEVLSTTPTSQRIKTAIQHRGEDGDRNNGVLEATKIACVGEDASKLKEIWALAYEILNLVWLQLLLILIMGFMMIAFSVMPLTNQISKGILGYIDAKTWGLSSWKFWALILGAVGYFDSVLIFTQWLYGTCRVESASTVDGIGVVLDERFGCRVLFSSE